MNNLRYLRKTRTNLTMKQLGEIVGVSESAIGNYETGKREPDYEMLLKLSEAIGCTVADIKEKEIDETGISKDKHNDVYDAIFDKLSYDHEYFEFFNELQSMRDDADFRNLMDGYKKMRSDPNKVRIMKKFMKSLNDEEDDNIAN